MIEVTDLRQDEVTKEANTVHIVSMNVTGGEVRVVELDSVKSSAIKRHVGGEESYFMTGISRTMHFKDSKFCLGNTHFSVLL